MFSGVVHHDVHGKCWGLGCLRAIQRPGGSGSRDPDGSLGLIRWVSALAAGPRESPGTCRSVEARIRGGKGVRGRILNNPIQFTLSSESSGPPHFDEYCSVKYTLRCLPAMQRSCPTASTLAPKARVPPATAWVTSTADRMGDRASQAPWQDKGG
jgi:hypothetical protein